MNHKFEQLKPYLEKQMALQTAITLFEWDNETLAPKSAMEKTSKVIGILSDEYFQSMVNESVKKLLKECQQEDDLSDGEKAIVEKLSEDIRLLEAIPPQEYREFSELKGKSIAAWTKAKENNDFSAYIPVLKQMVERKKKFAKYQAKEGQKSYDALLDQYEKDFFMEDLDRFFEKLKQEIVPLLKQVVEKSDKVDKRFLLQEYPIKKQKKFNRSLAKYLGFDFDKGVMSQSAHPFTTNLHNEDVRITTHYYENNLASAIFSTIHETGHALYEMGIEDEFTQTPVGAGASCGMHESQSRFFENIIGRSKAFWKPIYKKLQKTFPGQLGQVDLDHFVLAINKAEPGLIRVEADELTYCLHIIVRYEVEKKIFEEDYPIEKLPKLWNSLYEEYLGITPSEDRQGVLQDIHWAMGDFGYFPSYALGNAFAAQIYHQMKKELNVDKLLETGKVSEITAWLRGNIHQYGASRKVRRMLKDITGEEFNPQYYIDYLKEKYAKLYLEEK